MKSLWQQFLDQKEIEGYRYYYKAWFITTTILILFLVAFNCHAEEEPLALIGACAAHLITHETGHIIATYTTGGKVVGGGLNYIETEGGNSEVIGLAGFSATSSALFSLVAYRENNPDNDSKFLDYWTWLSLLDLPVNTFLSYMQDDGDINNSGLNRGWFVGASILQTYCYFNKVKNLSVALDDKGIIAKLTYKF